MSGWIKLSRKFLESEFWQEKRTFSKAEAWLDLIFLANYEDKTVNFDGEEILVKRGSFITSIRKLCDRWSWSNSKVTKFLSDTKKDGMTDSKSDTKKTLVTIVNYDLYQFATTKKRQQKRQLKRHKKHTTKEIYKINKKRINNKSTIINSKKSPVIPFQEIVDLYNSICVSMRKVQKVGASRKTLIKARWNEHGKDIEVFKTLFTKAEESDWLCGRAKGNDDWVAGFDWLLIKSKMPLVLEGNYDNKKPKKKEPEDDYDWYFNNGGKKQEQDLDLLFLHNKGGVDHDRETSSPFGDFED